LTSGTDRLGGVQDLDALVAYLAPTLSPHSPYDATLPVLGEPRIVRVP
jgi:5'-nucleotidase